MEGKHIANTHRQLHRKKDG